MLNQETRTKEQLVTEIFNTTYEKYNEYSNILKSILEDIINTKKQKNGTDTTQDNITEQQENDLNLTTMDGTNSNILNIIKNLDPNENYQENYREIIKNFITESIKISTKEITINKEDILNDILNSIKKALENVKILTIEENMLNSVKDENSFIFLIFTILFKIYYSYKFLFKKDTIKFEITKDRNLFKIFNTDNKKETITISIEIQKNKNQKETSFGVSKINISNLNEDMLEFVNQLQKTKQVNLPKYKMKDENKVPQGENPNASKTKDDAPKHTSQKTQNPKEESKIYLIITMIGILITIITFIFRKDLLNILKNLLKYLKEIFHTKDKKKLSITKL